MEGTILGVSDGSALGILLGTLLGLKEGTVDGTEEDEELGTVDGATNIWSPPPHAQQASSTDFPLY